MKNMIMAVNENMMTVANEGNLKREAYETWEAIQDFGYTFYVMLMNIISLLVLVACKVVKKARKVWIPAVKKALGIAFIKVSGAVATTICFLIIAFKVAKKGLKKILTIAKKGMDVAVVYSAKAVDFATEAWFYIIANGKNLIAFRKAVVADSHYGEYDAYDVFDNYYMA